MTAANVINFYAQAHWGSRYGVIDSAHPTPHKGLDCGLFHGTVQVPALHSGKVVAVKPSSSVGHYVTVQRSDGKFDTYCHIVPSASVGAQVSQGTNLGRQAVTQAEGGTAWLGQHTHLTLSDTLTGWATWGPHNLDPTPGVIAVLTGTADNGSSPLTDEGDPDMFTFGSNNRGGWVGGNGGTRLANPEEWGQVFGKFPHFEFGTNDRAFDVFQAGVTTLPPYPTVDQAALSSSITAAVEAAVKASPLQVDEKAIAAVVAPAVDVALADNFAALPAAVVKAEGAALANG